jgi:hypothetical protein
MRAAVVVYDARVVLLGARALQPQFVESQSFNRLAEP